MLRMCLTTKQTRENLRSIRFALMMFWLLQGYIEDQEHVRHATRLGLAVKKCVQDEPGSNRLPVSVLSRLRSSVDDDRFPLTKEEQAEWKRIVDVKVDSKSTLRSSAKRENFNQISFSRYLIYLTLEHRHEKRRQRFVVESLETSAKYSSCHDRSCGGVASLWYVV